MIYLEIGDIVKINPTIHPDNFRFGDTHLLLKWQQEATELSITEVILRPHNKNVIKVKFNGFIYSFDPNELILVRSEVHEENTFQVYEAVKMWADGEKLEYFDNTLQTWKQVHPENHYFDLSVKYRKADSTITVNGKEIPKPMSAKPAPGTLYYVPDPNNAHSPWECEWGSEKSADYISFSNGLCHDNIYAAIQHALALTNNS